jgi:hypothetical protein
MFGINLFYELNDMNGAFIDQINGKQRAFLVPAPALKDLRILFASLCYFAQENKL